MEKQRLEAIFGAPETRAFTATRLSAILVKAAGRRLMRVSRNVDVPHEKYRREGSL